MSNPLHAQHYADHAQQCRAAILENVCLAESTYRVRLHCPAIAARILPGQFVMLHLTGADDPLLGRPLALYDTVLDASGAAVAVDIVYLVVGKMTSRLAQLSTGRQVDLWGPLGNGFPPQPTRHLIMVAGGIGQTPFRALAQECLGNRRYGDPQREVSQVERVTLCYGARSEGSLADVEQFEAIGVVVNISTEDGSRGHHGLVTEVLGKLLASGFQDARLVCCGPEPMMEAVAGQAAAVGLPCHVSLETPMACGIGICFSCVARVRDKDGDWDYKRTCVEGPVFDAEKIVW